MLSLEQLRKIDPRLKSVPDEELEHVRAKLYEIGQFAFEEWIKEKNKSKAVPISRLRLMTSLSGSCKL
jgi:hypothetical protein